MRRFREYRHLLLILLIGVFLVLYLLDEHFITENYWVSYCPLDDHIPFLEGFIVPYVLWYPSLAAVGLTLLFAKEKPAFCRYVSCLGVGLILCYVICAVFPNGQDLRPVPLPRDNVFTRLIAGIYAADTNTNVFPSAHVVGSAVTVFGTFDSKTLRRWYWRSASVLLFLLICAACVFIKQHSILDVFSGLALAAILYVPFYLLPKRRARRKGTDSRT